jgi:hypothetical protein
LLPPVELPPATLPSLELLPFSVSIASGFDYVAFFDSVTTTSPVYIEGSKLDGLIAEAASFPPIDLASPEAVRLYLVRENAQAPTTVARYLVFVNGHVPYRGDAQFNLAYFNYANYAQNYC